MKEGGKVEVQEIEIKGKGGLRKKVMGRSVRERKGKPGMGRKYGGKEMESRRANGEKWGKSLGGSRMEWREQKGV